MVFAGALLLATIPSGFAQTSMTLATFSGANGANPTGPLVLATDGNFYGTTVAGGTDGSFPNNYGTIFKMTPGGVITVVFNFEYGDSAPSALIQGTDGNFYGTTKFGTAAGGGTIFQFNPSTGTLTTLYEFTGISFDGGAPRGGLLQGADGNLYGTTSGGGKYHNGTIFVVSPPFTGLGPLVTLYAFCSLDNCADGNTPITPLVQGADGNIYGTTANGGTNSYGTVFSIAPPFTPAGVSFNLLYSFCALPNCIDGGTPQGALVQGTDGKFYGTTSAGGTNDQGTVFSIAPPFTPAGVKFNPLYSFTGTGADGGGPESALVQGTDGNFYGTASSGGNGAGTFFKMNPAINPAVAGEYYFDASTEGSLPVGLIQVPNSANFLVNNSEGGANGDGTVFEVSLGMPAGTFTISGQVTLSGTGLSGVTMTLSGSQSATATTDSSGNYTFTDTAGGNYTVTPSLGSDTFSPASQTFTNLSANQTQNFTASATTGSTFTISGQVTLSGTGLSGVTMTLSGPQSGSATTTTDSSGNYTFTEPAGGNYTVTPSLGSDTFSPASQTFTNLSANQTQNFTASAVGSTFTIAGQVTLSGGALSGVTMTVSGQGGTSGGGSVSTDASGNYSFSLPAGGSYLVTPSLSGDTFSPASQTFNNLSANQTQNFTASATTGGTFTISGQVTDSGGNPLSGVSVTLSGSQSATATTDSSGNYTFNEPAGGNYTVTPSLSGDTFTPASQTFNNLSSNQTQNFTASATGNTFTISGQVTLSGSGLSGVTVTLSAQSGSGATATTDSSGNYTFTEPAGGNYTITPSLSGDTFSPASQTFKNLSGNQTQNFTASAATNSFTVNLSYQGSIGLASPPAGTRFTVAPHIPGFTIGPFGSQDVPFTTWADTPTITFFATAYSGMNIVGSMPHLASGGAQWTTTFTLLNDGATSANVALNFFDDNGNPLPLALTFPQGTPNQTTAAFTGVMAAGAGLVIETAGLSNPLVSGWAQLLSDGDVSGFAVFTDNVTATQQQQAVVPLQSLNLPAYRLYFDNTNGFTTAVALANQSAQPATITAVVRDDTGAQIATQAIQLPAKGHTAFGLATNFSAAANLRGSVEFDQPANGQVSVLGLSFNPASAFTSIPVTPLPGDASATPHASMARRESGSQSSPRVQSNSFNLSLNYQFDPSFTGTPPAGAGFTVTPHIPGITNTPFGSLDLPFSNWSGGGVLPFGAIPFAGMNYAGSMPHLASGGGQWTTTFTILNTGASTAHITLNLFDDNGNPLSLPVTFPQTSATAVTDSTFTGPLNAGEVLLIQTAGLNNPLASGWAQLLSDGDVSGFAVFTDNVTASQQQQAVVPLQSLNPSAYQLWFDNTNGFATGVALANESAQSATISLLVRDDTGKQITTQSIQLPGLGHTAFVLATSFPITANLRGTVEFSEPADGQISVLGLSFNPASAFTSIPAVAQ
jgi:uncharacterized repeat protein (TIGR03803 family)